MSVLLEAVAVANESKHSRYIPNGLVNNNHKRILRSKENIFKPKCSKELKKKLRKYKLRHDGNEDPEVLDVSQILVNSLRIKSPNNSENINNNKFETGELKPSNYLFKMVRKRKICMQIDSINGSATLQQNSDLQSVSPDENTLNNKETNAFKLMMDSRNKSIGSNSPGKEKSSNEIVIEEIIEKKEIKTKRILSLQKMAEAKGLLKNKEVEDYREKCIQKKMLKRAIKLKDMITKPDVKIDKKEQVAQSYVSNCITKSQVCDDVVKHGSNKNSSNEALQLCDIFSDKDIMINKNKPINTVLDEDIEFLQKLSPSLRKKENMLCYFQKVSKETELNCEQSENKPEEISNSIIKVKFTPKRKKKVKKFKSNQNGFSTVSNNKDVSEDLLNKNLDNSEPSKNVETRKRKRDQQLDGTPLILIKEANENIELDNNENRPKRITKKPVKYTEDVQCFSSDDEELHIFTPKKKRNSEKDLKSKSNKNIHTIDQKLSSNEMPAGKKRIEIKLKFSKQSTRKTNSITTQDSKAKSKTIRDLTITGSGKSNKNPKHLKVEKEKKSVKLAPIFVAKSQLSQEALEAKQKFLKSGVPEKLKKNIVLQTNSIMLYEKFHTVHHVQQDFHYDNNFIGRDWFKTCNEVNETEIKTSNYMCKALLTNLSSETIYFPIFKDKPDKFLKSIKDAYPKFPVYRTYHRLKSKSKGDFKDCNYTNLDNSVEIVDSCLEVNNDNPERLNWCDKYKPTSSKQIIGNFESIKELKRWLETWSEKLTKAKINASDESEMSDFCCSDSGDSTRAANNVLILTGPTGSGKTSSVYAVAAELSIKVIEVNASSKRNGKIMLQDLQEATQSHKVDRAKSGSECSQKSQELPILITKKRGRPKKLQELVTTKKANSKPQSISLKSESGQPILSQDCMRTGMSLILIDDADIVFDQDDGFSSAISQLIHSSKRPVILVTSSLSCPHLQKFVQNGKILHMYPFLPRMLGTWLDIMCLADVGKCYMGLGERLLDFYMGDIRKSINCLQFYMNSYRTSQAEDVILSQVKCLIDDENSSMSWTDTENLDGILPSKKDSQQIDKQLHLLHGSLNVFDIWWSLGNHGSRIKNEDKKGSHLKRSQESKDIKNLAEVLETICIVDYIGHVKPDTRANITSKPWYCEESTSLLEHEDFDNYNETHYISEDISNMLMKSAITGAQKVFDNENDICIRPPAMGSHRERNRLVSRHNTLSSYLNSSSILDRRATALDYWPSCRTLCRVEKNKTDYSLKRNNRFCHYLKSLNILCRNDFFDKLADSLSSLE